MNEVIERFNQSFARAIEGRDEEFFEHFYKRFLSRSVVAREKFAHTDMSRQKQMVRASLLELMQFYTSGKPNEYMKRVAHIHGPQGSNIGREEYFGWLDALLDTVKEFDTQFDDEVDLAWRIVLAPGIAYMAHAVGR